MVDRILTIYFAVLGFVCFQVSHQETEFERQSLVTYTRCDVDAFCHRISNNSFCYGNDQGQPGKCKCLEGYELVSRNRTFFACLGAAGYGEQCEKNIQCQLILTENAECFENKCQCKENSHRYTDGRCYVSVKLEELCRSDANCWLNDGTFGNCVNGRCTCKYDRQVPTTEKTSCIDGRRLSESCDNDAQCAVVPNAVCRVKCECAAGFALSRDEQRCLMAARQFGDTCEENDQCSTYLSGSVCNDKGTCACPTGFHGVGSKCTRSFLRNEACSSNDECSQGVTECLEGSCQCLPGVVNETVGCNGSRRVLGGGFLYGFGVFVVVFGVLYE